MKTSLSQVISGPPFTLDFRVLEPRLERPSSLLILLHGVGGSETNLAALAASVSPDVLVVMPRGPLTLAAGQYAWFHVTFTSAGPAIAEREAEESRKMLIRFVNELQTLYGVRPSRTVIAGFSQGGILSASVALSSPESVRGFAVLSGRILPEVELAIASRDRLANLRGLIAHGLHDTTLPLAWAELADSWLSRLGVAHDMRLYPVDHSIPAKMASDFVDWLSETLPSTAEAV